MTETPKAEVHDVVQVDPEHCRFGPVFVIVTEVREGFIQGYFLVPDDEGKAAPAYVRVKHEHYVRIGTTEWAVQRGAAEPSNEGN